MNYFNEDDSSEIKFKNAFFKVLIDDDTSIDEIFISQQANFYSLMVSSGSYELREESTILSSENSSFKNRFLQMMEDTDSFFFNHRENSHFTRHFSDLTEEAQIAFRLRFM